MSDDPFMLPPVPLMAADRARDIGRAYQALANHLADLYPAQAARETQRAQWWLTYAIAIAQTEKPGGKQ